MNRFLHLLKHIYIFNKVSMLYYTITALVILVASNTFSANSKEFSEGLIRYSVWIMSLVTMSKISPKSSSLFDIKHLLAMPLSKFEITYIMPIAEVIVTLPFTILIITGVTLSEYSFSRYLAYILVFTLNIAVNLFVFNKRIDGSRTQHVKTSVYSFLKYVQKLFNLFVAITILSFVGVLIYVLFKPTNTMLVYMAIVLSICVYYVFANFTIVLLKDESKSHFIVKRDGKIFLGQVMIILMLFAAYDNLDENVKSRMLKSTQLESILADELDSMVDLESKRVFLAITQNDIESFNSLLENDNEFPWDKHISGNFPVHFLVHYNRFEMLKSMLEKNPDALNKEGAVQKKTPIFAALKACNMEMINFITKHSIDLNHKDIFGNTPLIYSAQNKCYGGLLLLKNLGANEESTNKKGYNVANYIPEKIGLRELFKVKAINLEKNRELASKKTSEASLESRPQE